ncbi:MAG: valine--tRNA ligase [Solirubrobacteraceae bacterium]|nr:valine--tRNA ligase [Solirubrobacteraceae bacterium]
MPASDLSTRTRYEPAEVEPEIVERWLSSGAYETPPADPSRPDQETFSIAIPPPNVTGVLHMGHALNGSIQDSLIRLNRMRGKRTKWILGTDHAGIATQTQVEKKLAREGRSREELGREGFTVETQAWRKEYGGKIIEQFKRIGASCDYSGERFTMDDGYVRAVQKVFIDLFEQGLIYRDHYMVNWDPGSGSAISDLEVEEQEGVEDVLYSIAYPFADGDGEIVVATVRPETMFGDVAVAVNPEDERYASAIGREVELPLSGGRTIPVIADDHVKVDFGSGALKITPGHDPNDFEIGRRHSLPAPSAIGEDGRMTELAGEFAGLPTEDAKTAVVEALRASGALRAEDPYVHTVPFSQRSGKRIEPLISLQWFMKMDELAKPAIEAVTDGRVTIHPPVQSRRYVDWLSEIRPWCVSRQLWWGHQLPVYYRGDSQDPTETYVGIEPPEGEGWTRDEDVMDTWFSSGLWPFATLGWPDETDDLKDFYPTSVLSTARDILHLWVARMVMLGLRFGGDVPFEDVYIHSVIQAPDGRRMSKSLGTGIDPLDVINGGPRPPVFKQGGDFPAYGADAVRFGLLAISTTQDVRFSEDKVQQGQQLANKLFNATRFVLLQLEERGLGDIAAEPRPRTDADRWILSRLERVARQTAESLDGFEFAKASLGLYDFVYGELCDWFVELAKPRLRDGDEETQRDLAATLLFAIDKTLRIAHPVIPFVTEELWSHLPGDERGLLVSASWPERDDDAVDEAAEAGIAELIETVTAVRGWRERVGVKPSAILPARLRASLGEEREASLRSLARIDLVTGSGDAVATVTSGGVVVDFFADDNIDLEAAEKKKAAERDRIEGEIKRISGKLSNANFVERAPEAVVQVERDKLAVLEEQLAAL